MDEPIDIIFGNRFCNTFGSFDVNILQREVPSRISLCVSSPRSTGLLLCGVGSADKIIYDIRMPHTFFNRLRISKVKLLAQSVSNRTWRPLAADVASYVENDPAKISRDLQMALGHFFPVGNDNRTSLPS
jgi:hypothetical protein